MPLKSNPLTTRVHGQLAEHLTKHAQKQATEASVHVHLEGRKEQHLNEELTPADEHRRAVLRAVVDQERVG